MPPLERRLTRPLCVALGALDGELAEEAANLGWLLRLLLHSGLSISEIAYGLGFKDPGYFSRFFTRQLGVTPRDYRASGSRSG